MLENRPIAQKALLAAGVFSVVFWSAMAGTAFMLTGGIGFASHVTRTTPVHARIYGHDHGELSPLPLEDNWANDARQYVVSEEPEASPASLAQAGYPNEDLAGETDAQANVQAYVQAATLPLDETELARQIDQDYAAYEASAYGPDEDADDEFAKGAIY